LYHTANLLGFDFNHPFEELDKEALLQRYGFEFVDKVDDIHTQNVLQGQEFYEAQGWDRPGIIHWESVLVQRR